MASVAEILRAINNGKFDKSFKYIYQVGENDVLLQRQRYINTINEFCNIFNANDQTQIRIFSAPGRTEVGGNHTDHNLGKVIAASVNLDVIGIVTPNDENIIRVQSKGFAMDTVDLSSLEVSEKEKNKSVSLVRGVAAKFASEGHNVGGFNAYTTSNVLKGSGLSSSAAYEVLVGTVLNNLYNNGEVSAVKIAMYSQFAENVYFGKASGLLDQLTSSVGGFITVDFKDAKNPAIRKVEFDFAQSGHDLCIVDTKGSHADLSDDYSSIPFEMKSVAQVFGKQVLSEVCEDEFYANVKKAREATSDRAVLRAIHFFEENKRVDNQAKALEENNFDEFKKQIIASGNSSYKFLQNVYTPKKPLEQGLGVALCLAEKMLDGKGAFRVHGGGFAGTIQAFVPHEITEEFKNTMNEIFGEGSCYILSVRPVGGTEITK